MAGKLKFVVTDRTSNVLGDMSDICKVKSVTHRLNRPATAHGLVPSHLVPYLRVGDRALKVYLDGVIDFNGIIWFVEDEGDEDAAYTEFLAVDPMIWWKFRPARDADGDFSLPTFLTDFKNGPAIIREIVKNAVEALNSDGLADGPMGIDYTSGVFETGTGNLSGAPIDWPETLGEVVGTLTDTGAVDVVLTPIDSAPGSGIMVKLNVYNQAGVDRSASISFEYQTGLYNARHMKRTEDMDTISNAVRYYFTPKESIQRYRANVTKDDGGTVVVAGVKTPKDPPDPNSPKAQTALLDLIEASRLKYGKFVTWRTYDTSTDFFMQDMKQLYWRLWRTESLLRVKPRELVSILPDRGVLPAFGLGDTVSVKCGPKVRGGFSGNQRVYEYTLLEEVDGPLEISEIVTSADQES